LKRGFLGTIAALTFALILSGCALLDNQARDKEACDRLSSLLGSNNASLGEETSADLISRLETEVLPMASGQFVMKIRQLIDSYRNIESESIFDKLAGTSDTFLYAGEILDYCVNVSRSRG
jgi:hypothetical protein